MPSFIDHQKAFIAEFNATARYHSRYQVFRDFVSCAAAALHNRVCMNDSLEQAYMETIGRYEKDDVIRFSHLLSRIILGMHDAPRDFLGSVFMQLEFGDSCMGQFFTPWDISRMMAKIQLMGVDALLKTKPFVTLSEPACGAGCMILASAEELREQGFDPLHHLWVSATDIDSLAADMAFVQLSLAGIPAQVITGNALTRDCRRVLFTPAHYYGGWSRRLDSYQDSAA
ncbi:N-6 DNA methylase [Dickeya dianthicola]|uniref:N-6 DNA methylase n=1 Tax=Dickeya dianthicola TaxID=204039 RepID=UPI0003A904D7|nr:N-6 DNA methylase [Dickeya dianthicola]MCI4031817.1 N-6 DNA methylase [Dickeya dianthicola]MCI4175195.1 N-6 DNA methylase [Dickeya dianthicola]MCI4179430.1 N-6 DNA methylase [Dickeya dianthicola]MCI4182395.1 N-6 DNA methylase [Dickeya dianthicola]MCI4196781.1 N-6 DNA methylase [Dickeya dianthicola]